MHPRKLIRDSVGYAFTQYLVRAALMLRGIVAARLLGPGAYGAWNAIQLIMDYGVFAPLGTQQGLDQAIPARIVEGDAARLDRMKRAGLLNIIVLTLLFCGFCFAWVTFGRSSRVLDAWGMGGFLAALACIVLTNLAYFHLTLLRSHGNITAVSGWYLLQGSIGACVGLAAIPRFGAWGLLGGWLLGTLVASVYTRWQGRAVAPLVPALSSDSVALIRVGVPMFIFMASSLVMRSLDRIIILRYLGTQNLGYYSLSVMALTFLLYLPDSLGYVLYPQLLKRYSESGQDPAAIRDRVDRVLQAMAVIVPALCGVAYVMSRELVELVLPKFVPGVHALRVLCFGAVGLALGNLGSIVLMTLGRQNLLVPTALFATAVGAALDLLAVKLGYGITGVAWATMGSYALSGALLMTLTSAGLGRSPSESLRQLARAFAPLGIAIVLAYVLDRFLPQIWPGLESRSALRLIVAVPLFVAGYLMLAMPFARGMGLRLLLSEFNLPVIGPLARRFGRGRSPEVP